MRATTTALTLCLACGSGSSVVDAPVDANPLFMVGSCGSAWGSAAQAQDFSSSIGCQVACADPPTYDLGSCSASDPEGIGGPTPAVCSETFEVDGARGCCIIPPGEPVGSWIGFYECM